MNLDDETLAGATRALLYRRARDLDIRGRASMNRNELAAALRAARPGPDGDGTDTRGMPAGQRMSAPVSRVESFRDLARRRAEGEMVLLPRRLRGNDRRLHVRQTLREDHATRITRAPRRPSSSSRSWRPRAIRSSGAPACCSTATWPARTR